MRTISVRQKLAILEDNFINENDPKNEEYLKKEDKKSEDDLKKEHDPKE